MADVASLTPGLLLGSAQVKKSDSVSVCFLDSLCFMENETGYQGESVLLKLVRGSIFLEGYLEWS